MIAHKKHFTHGALLMVGFTIVFVVMFFPIFAGQNAFDYMDNLFNSISKGSAYYIEGLKKDTEKLAASPIDVKFTMRNALEAEQTETLYRTAGADVVREGESLQVRGDLRSILLSALADSDEMFHNRGEAVSSRYGYGEREALYNWWASLRGVVKDLNHQERFQEATFIGNILKRGVECAYNYYKVVPEKISDKVFIVIFSLVFYVIYTLWYGYAILFMFEGWGLKLEH